jgi:antirestriction protein ArdC
MAARRGKQASEQQRAQWAAERQAKLAELHQRIVDEVSKLTNGEQWRKWLAFAVNFHDYSFANTLAIWAQRPDATWVAGYERWKKLGRQVRKGETGIAILAPITGRVGVRDTTTQPGEASTPPGETTAPRGDTGEPDPPGVGDDEPTRRVLRGFKIVHVFDVSQTAGEGPEIPTRPQTATVTPHLLEGQAPPGLWDALVHIAQEHGYTVSRGDCGGANGTTDYTTRTITVRADVDDAQAVKTMIHELGHVKLHTPEDFGWGTTAFCRGQREVEAESVAYLVAAHYGLDTASYSFAYVTGWAQRAATTERKSPEDIVRAAGQRIITAAFAITEAADAALGAAADAPSQALSDRVTAGADRVAALRRTAEAAAGQAMPPDADTAARSSAGPAHPSVARAFPPLRQVPRGGPAEPAGATAASVVAVAAAQPGRGR